MKPLYRMRSLLEKLGQIPGAILDAPPETTPADNGETSAQALPEYVRTYHATGASASSAPMPAGDGDDEEDPGSGYEATPEPIFEITPEVDSDDVLAQIAHRVDGHYRAQTLLRGVDALGYYLTFHQRRYQWGIYLPLTGLAWVTAFVLGRLEVPASRKLTLAAELVLSHERFHYAVDCAVGQLELLQRRPVYWPANSVPAETRGTLTELEEECANAAMLRMVRHARTRFPEKGLPRLVLDFIKVQPAGYNAAEPTARSRHRFENRILDLLQAVLEASSGAEPPYGAELHHLAPHARPWDLARCPVMVIDDRSLFSLEALGVRFIGAITAIAESPQFVRSLERLGEQGRRHWSETKRKLGYSTLLSGLDFRPFFVGKAAAVRFFYMENYTESGPLELAMHNP